MKNINLKKEEGIALLITIIVVGVLTLLAFSLGNIAFRGLIISTAGLESQKSFYAADSGAECIIYRLINPDNKNYECGKNFTSDADGDAFKFRLTGSTNDPCVSVSVEEGEEEIPGLLEKVISSRGYSNCQLQTMERGIKIRYFEDSRDPVSED